MVKLWCSLVCLPEVVILHRVILMQRTACHSRCLVTQEVCTKIETEMVKIVVNNEENHVRDDDVSCRSQRALTFPNQFITRRNFSLTLFLFFTHSLNKLFIQKSRNIRKLPRELPDVPFAKNIPPE